MEFCDGFASAFRDSVTTTIAPCQRAPFLNHFKITKYHIRPPQAPSTAPPHCQLTALPLTTRAKNLRLIRFQSIYPDGRVLILQGSEQTPDKEHWTFSFSLIPGMGGLIPSRTAMSKGAMRKWLRQRASWKGDQLLANDLWEELRIIRKETAMERTFSVQFPYRSFVQEHL